MINLEIYDKEAREVLDEVYEEFGQFSAWKLRCMTHEEPPWKEAYASGGGEISQESIRQYFKTFVSND